MIRFWHLAEDENYNLTVFDVLTSEANEGVNLQLDKISSIVYDSRGRSLVAGTKNGCLLFWKNSALNTDSPVDKDQWIPQPFLNLSKTIQTLTVGRNNSVIVCKQNDGEVIVVSETKICAKISGNYEMILKSGEKIEILYEDSREKASLFIKAKHHIKGIDMFNNKILYWTSKSIEILAINKIGANALREETVVSIPKKSLKCLFADDNTVIITTDFGFNLLGMDGNIKKTLDFPESEGKINGVEIQGGFLITWSQSSYIRVFNSKGDIRQIGDSRKFENTKGLIGTIKSCSISPTGNTIGIISSKIEVSGDSATHSFHIYDRTFDSFIECDLGENKIPVSFYWDQKEERYFGVQVECTKISILKEEETR